MARRYDYEPPPITNSERDTLDELPRYAAFDIADESVANGNDLDALLSGLSDTAKGDSDGSAYDVVVYDLDDSIFVIRGRDGQVFRLVPVTPQSS